MFTCLITCVYKMVIIFAGCREDLQNVGHSSNQIFKLWETGCPALIWKCIEDRNLETETYNNKTDICV